MGACACRPRAGASTPRACGWAASAIRRRSTVWSPPAAGATRCWPIASMPVRCSRWPRSATVSIPACAAGCSTASRTRDCATSYWPAATARCARAAASRTCASRRAAPRPASAASPAPWTRTGTASAWRSTRPRRCASTGRPASVRRTTCACRATSPAGARARAGKWKPPGCASTASATAPTCAAGCGSRATARDRTSTWPPSSTMSPCPWPSVSGCAIACRPIPCAGSTTAWSTVASATGARWSPATSTTGRSTPSRGRRRRACSRPTRTCPARR